MRQRPDCLEHALTLAREAFAPGPQPLAEITHPSNVCRLAHIPEDGSAVQLIHFPRNLYVDIPGRGKDEIKAAWAHGREPLLVETMDDLLKVRIDHVARTDFKGFKAMTDAVGGVRVYAEEASNGDGNGGPFVVKQGWNDLDLRHALADQATITPSVTRRA